MGKSNVEKLARLLKGLVLAVFICNLIALFFVPCVVLLSPLGLFQQLADRILHLLQIRPFGEDDVYVPMERHWGNFLRTQKGSGFTGTGTKSGMARSVPTIR